MKNIRIEEDSMGKVEVPSEAYFGGQTARAQHNFQISKHVVPAIFRQALGMVKLAAAQTNTSLGLIDKKLSKVIVQACEEFIDGKFDADFTLDVFQAGAGTSYNMNANEIIANRANELLGGKKGEYKFVHPNNHVNMAQSTNDVIPTATRIATLLSIPGLLQSLNDCEETFEKIAKKHAKLIKVGRTHLEDAVPITLGQEFDSYKEALHKAGEFIANQSEDLQTLGIGGTAVGTGINTHAKYRETMVKNLTKMIGLHFQSGKNLTEMANNMNGFLNFSASLRSLAVNTLNICSDLKLMNMGPKAGIAEITLPGVQPGSSIMPGKVNPSIPECLEMICMQVLGNDKTIEIACQKSNFELNVFCPIIMWNLLQSMEILSNGLKMLNEFALKDLQINEKQIKKLFEESLCTATSLSPKLGYTLTAEIVKAALKKEITIKQEVLSRKLMSEKELDKLIG
ncbi:aspartate ammonia-lyase [Candidatus Gracilibacteria bacterium]|nr:aspartate ammonia-lyase [Candidatus Gracilibacteria bacterium]